jgi:hypothetical protein
MENNYSVKSTLEDAAAEIKRSSFTVFRVPPRTAHAMQAAWREAATILSNPPSTSAASNCDEWTRIVGGHLHGYNEPSHAKRLFRAFPASSEQPWPNDRFRTVSQTVALQLHEILLTCHAHLRGNPLQDAGLKRSQDQSRNETKVREEQIVSRREQFQETTTGTNNDDLRKRRRLDQVTTNLPANCPLDYFLYHNKDPTATNCTEHVDRGLLIAVCLTDVPGLEILVKEDNKEDCKGNWFCPEVAVHNSNLYNEIPDSSVSDLICIMAGGELSRDIETDVPPCVHRVRNHLKRSRLSISYELR